MIILQTAGGDDATGFASFGARLFGDSSLPSTTFRNNDYIHRLNRALQWELRAVCAYRSVGSLQSFSAEELLDDHRYSGRQLVRIIVANRGIPEDQTPFSGSVAGTVVRFCSVLPPRMGRQATAQTLLTLERTLQTAYEKLLEEAPRGDAELLGLLRQKTLNHIEQIQGR